MNIESARFVLQKSVVEGWAHDNKVLLLTLHWISWYTNDIVYKANGLFKVSHFNYGNKARHGCNNFMKRFSYVQGGIQNLQACKVDRTPSNS